MILLLTNLFQSFLGLESRGNTHKKCEFDPLSTKVDMQSTYDNNVLVAKIKKKKFTELKKYCFKYFLGVESWGNRHEICEFEALPTLGDTRIQKYKGERTPQRGRGGNWETAGT